MALSVRASCAGVAAKAPTQRAARRNAGAECGASACGLTPTEEAAAAAASGGDRSYLCSTPSSDGVECVFAFPVGAARHRARRCTQVRCCWRLQRRADGHGSKGSVGSLQGDVGRHPSRTGGGDDGAIALHAPRPAIMSPRAAPRHRRLVRVRNPQRLPRTNAGKLPGTFSTEPISKLP